MTHLSKLRVWRDDATTEHWRLAYTEGGQATYVAFPDTDALNDFLNETLGFALLDEPDTLPYTTASYPFLPADLFPDGISTN